jgi:hypothetical protein
MQIMWPREANLTVVQLAEKCTSTTAVADALSSAYGQTYTPRQVGQQIDRLRLNPTRQSQATTKESCSIGCAPRRRTKISPMTWRGPRPRRCALTACR